jgi:hypothetical protein
MKIKDFDNASKLPKLQAMIVESILICCNNGSSFHNLVLVLQRKLPSSSSPRPSNYTIKKHLFHLINYDLIKYSGQKREYDLQDEGFVLLDWIKKEKIKMNADIKDILITIE